MSAIVSAYVFPHPPIVIPEIGRGSENDARETVDAMIKASEHIKIDNPDTIIIVTPHGPVFQDFIYISTSEKLYGNFSNFENEQVELEFENNLFLVEKIIKYAQEDGIYSGGLEDGIAKKHKVSKNLDHGALVPLYYIDKQFKGAKLVHISIAGLPFEELYLFGKCIDKAVKDIEEKVVLVSSGDLSHRLSKDAPYGYSRKGKEFDNLVVNAFKNLDVKSLLMVDESFCEEAGECGLRSFIMMFGALEGYEIESEVYSYEAPFGVGYSVAGFKVQGEGDSKDILKGMEEETMENINKIRENEDVRVRLARFALETYVRHNMVLPMQEWVPDEILNKRAGVFVSIKKKGQLRGCIGTISPTRSSIGEEIIYNAISSGTRDRRFETVRVEELSKLIYSVDVLGEPEDIESIEKLNVEKYGVIVSCDYKTGLLLPNLEGVDTPAQQLKIALEKAGIGINEDYKMQRFEVLRYT